jgi:hypothetical protein
LSAPAPSDDRPRGTVQKFNDARSRIYFRARIAYPDGERLWVGGCFNKKERAKEFADEKAREAEDRNITVDKMVPVAKGPPRRATNGRSGTWPTARSARRSGPKRLRQ